MNYKTRKVSALNMRRVYEWRKRYPNAKDFYKYLPMRVEELLLRERNKSKVSFFDCFIAIRKQVVCQESTIHIEKDSVLFIDVKGVKNKWEATKKFIKWLLK